MQSTIQNPLPTTPATAPYRETHWWTWAIRGLVAIAFGIMAFIWPGATITSLVIVFGVYAVIDGLFAIIESFKRRASDSRWWALLLEGLVSVVAGILALLSPALATVAFIYLIGVWAVATGIFEIVQAIRARDQIKGEGWLIAGGLLSVVFGVLLMLWPVTGAITLVWLVGGYAIGFGIVMLILAFNMNRHHKSLSA